jgi:hypothetical protein
MDHRALACLPIPIRRRAMPASCFQFNFEKTKCEWTSSKLNIIQQNFREKCCIIVAIHRLISSVRIARPERKAKPGG